ncbi:MAG: radical SAM protein, partial [Nitrospinota bacterium]
MELLEGVGLGKQQERLIHGKAVTDLDQYPYPKDFSIYSHRYRVAYDFEFTRGCFGKCTYCISSGNDRFGKAMRSRSVKGVLTGLSYYMKKYRFSTLVILDDNAPSNKKKFSDFCQQVSTLYPALTINLSSRVDCFTEETAKALSLFPCATVWFGFESNSPRILEFLRKNVSIEQNYRAASLCKKYNIQIGANVLVGVPTERERDFRITYDFTKEIEPDFLHYNVLSPHPGTWVYDYCRSNGLLKDPRTFDGYDHVEGLIRDGLIRGVDYNRIRSWWPHFESCVKNYDPLTSGVLFERAGDFERALKEFEKAFSSHGKSVRALFHSGSLQKRLGNMAKAISFFEQMEQYPCMETDVEYFAKRHFHCGELYFERGEKERAAREFAACL